MAAERARRRIPEATVARLPVYLRILSEQADDGVDSISSERLAELAGVNAAKVRKDLSLPRQLRHPRRRLRRRVPRLPDPPRARPHPRLAGRHRRRRQPRPGARQLRRVRRARLPGRRRRRHRRRPRSARCVGGVAVRHLDDLPEIVQAKQVSHRRHRHARRPPPRTPPTASCAPASRSILNFAPVVLTVPRGDRRAQGRPRRRAADPQLLRAAPRRRRRCTRRRPIARRPTGAAP